MSTLDYITYVRTYVRTYYMDGHDSSSYFMHGLVGVHTLLDSRAKNKYRGSSHNLLFITTKKNYEMPPSQNSNVQRNFQEFEHVELWRKQL